MTAPHHRNRGDADSSGKSHSRHTMLTVIILFCFLGIMPLLIWVSLPQEQPYNVVTSSSTLVQSAAADAGLKVCSQNGFSPEVPGAQVGILYELSPDCAAGDPAAAIRILVLGFTDTETMNAAIAMAQETYQAWPTTNTAAFMSGSTVILVQGAPSNQAVQQVSSALLESGAARIL